MRCGPMPHDTTRSSSSNFVQFLRKLLHWGEQGQLREPIGVPPSPGSSSLAPKTPQDSELSYTKSGPGSVVSSGSAMSEHSGAAGQHSIAFTVESAGIPHRARNTDAASVLTIASSSKKPRRRSIDTNASTRPLVAESIFSRAESVETEA